MQQKDNDFYDYKIIIKLSIYSPFIANKNIHCNYMHFSSKWHYV